MFYANEEWHDKTGYGNFGNSHIIVDCVCECVRVRAYVSFLLELRYLIHEAFVLCCWP